MQLTDAEMAGALLAGGFPANTISNMVAIAIAESGGNASATHVNSNGTTDYGFLQINSANKSGGNLFDPIQCAKAGYAIWKSQGYKAWSSYTNGRYATFIPRGLAAAGHPSRSIPGSTDNITVSVNGSSSGNGDGTAANSQLSAISQPGTWLRLGMFGMGGILLLIGIDRITGIPVGSIAKKAVML